jgi:hypothetical protein
VQPSTEPGTLAGLVTKVVRLLRLAGSRCCVGQADAAWRRTAERNLTEADRE